MLKLRARHNKHQAVWLVEPGVKVGRSAKNDLILDNPAVASLQFVIGVRGDRLVLKNRAPDNPLTVNGEPVEDRCAIREGDQIALGDLELEVIDPKKDLEQEMPVPSEWSLKANSAVMGGRVFPLEDVTLVGRSKECGIHLAAAHLSRRHAQLQVIDDLLYVKDLGSSNGTFLNGQKITESRVRRGDELRFDTLSFGVLGPADDLGKTTVRSTREVSSAVARQAAPRRPRPMDSEPRSPAAANARTRLESAPAFGETQVGPRYRGWVGGLVLITLVAAVMGVWLFQGS
ncbi:FHA domain-containing protein [Marinimicrobium agarilyticum]|uniref:FHA domain-containing protein n=1 Tax=Marinimicrobium agarilyticum TaxID=306546 RepID=UPI0003FF827B|nr:FHA domain-containing protein [Marinimicrobium agarilyticum]